MQRSWKRDWVSLSKPVGLAMAMAPIGAGSSQVPASSLTWETPILGAWREREWGNDHRERPLGGRVGHKQREASGFGLRFCDDNCLPLAKQ